MLVGMDWVRNIFLKWISFCASKNLCYFPHVAILPDFAQVYGSIGSVFNPNTRGHLQELKKMDHPLMLKQYAMLLPYRFD
ncbi:hypothetical protein HanOQP8_Chr01g0015041 [Helianthus annuus]|nr:hypothetical protein HanOQP8_Chr01g0015041 [Helianthus annuus]